MNTNSPSHKQLWQQNNKWTQLPPVTSNSDNKQQQFETIRWQQTIQLKGYHVWCWARCQWPFATPCHAHWSADPSTTGHAPSLFASWNKGHTKVRITIKVLLTIMFQSTNLLHFIPSLFLFLTCRVIGAAHDSAMWRTLGSTGAAAMDYSQMVHSSHCHETKGNLGHSTYLKSFLIG